MITNAIHIKYEAPTYAISSSSSLRWYIPSKSKFASGIVMVLIRARAGVAKGVRWKETHRSKQLYGIQTFNS